MNKTKSGWAGTIIWLILFWPVGLFRLFKKFNDKATLMGGKTKALTVTAWVLIAFSAFCLVISFGADIFAEAWFICLAFFAWIAGGILILLKVEKSKKKAEQYRKYLNVIVNSGERSIDNIASAMSVTYEAARSDIQAMIDDGFLKGACIHEGKREVVLRQDAPIAQPVYATQSSTAVETAPPQIKTVRCSGCGANNVVTDGCVTECEYCGTPLS